MNEKQPYQVINAREAHELSNLVSNAMAAGYVPQGSAYHVGRRHYQPVVHKSLQNEN
jgi:hypothetical protein